MFYSIFLTMFVLLIFGCGGGQQEPEADIKILDIPAVKTSTTYTGAAETMSATAECKAGVSCVINSVTVKWTNGLGQTITKTTPLNKIIAANGSASLTFTLLTDSDRVFSPLVYLKDTNPSTARTSYTLYAETIGEIIYTKTGLTGRKDCTSDSTTVNCTRFENVPTYDYTRGTMKFTDFTLSLEEATNIGTLTGDGSGLFNSTTKTWLLNFSKGIAENNAIYAMYVSPLRSLANFPEGRDVKVYYGNLTLQQDTQNRLVSGNTVYGSVVGNQIEITRAMGFKNAPVTVEYSGQPVKRYGGEKIGVAKDNCRGNTCTFTLQKSNSSQGIVALIKSSSIQVFTNDKIGTVQSYDPNSGNLVVSFSPNTPLSQDEEISASFYFNLLSIPIYIEFDTSFGKKSFVVKLEITRT
ncbi:MAG: hypothetical protein N3A62_01300 [Thermodesulfovibrionales bacterium]|nr:hypothetical protein [Thermodesulfovibrionales bacterium]